MLPAGSSGTNMYSADFPATSTPAIAGARRFCCQRTGAESVQASLDTATELTQIILRQWILRYVLLAGRVPNEELEDRIRDGSSRDCVKRSQGCQNTRITRDGYFLVRHITGGSRRQATLLHDTKTDRYKML